MKERHIPVPLRLMKEIDIVISNLFEDGDLSLKNKKIMSVIQSEIGEIFSDMENFGDLEE